TQHPSLPSSSSASENNTPIPSGSAASQSKKPTAKRKRTTDGASDSADGSAPAPRTRDGPKKKKANRACFHCQKAHLTCDDSRPCQRCIKRGMADNCTEGHRKKAKYLLDDEELGEPHMTYISPEAMFPAYQAPAQYGIPAEAANLEYSILSAILGGSPDSGSGGSPATTHAQQATVPNASSPTAVRLVPNWTTGSSLCTPNGTEGAVQSVYKSVTKGYDYTQGYHFLMKHLSRRRFEKNDILRIVRALPSFIALQMPMTEEDEVFVEKCFQRSLIELDKLVSFSGTPTVAWRRTGEICLVGPEFCMLTGWEKEELIGRRKYIYELFENQSVVEYWENFANHAFENTTQSVYSHCVLLKPSGAPVPCTFCFSIRRDIMDLPSLVIGQWLPLL
ncbi:transcription activator of gluconeogenesis ERT1, partial [Cubamyces menziesii]